jgi:general stress protein 26
MATEATHTADPDAAEKVKGLIGDERLAMLTTVEPSGKLVSRPMALQRIDDDGTIWFLADRTSAKADQLERDSRVNLAFSSRGTWISVVGDAYLDGNRTVIHDLWNSGAEAWFPDGPDAPDVTALRVDPHTAEYWDSPGGRVASVLAYAKSKVTGDRPDIGETKVVDL